MKKNLLMLAVVASTVSFNANAELTAADRAEIAHIAQQQVGPAKVDTLELSKYAGVGLVSGAAVGYGTVAASGLSAIGMVGSGTGIGMAAGPFGAIIGAGVGAVVGGSYYLYENVDWTY